jgi:hypothetical protein
MSRVSTDDLNIAADWLEVNEGDNGEAEACRRVAAFLQAEIDRRHKAAAVRAIAREKNVSPALVRKALAQSVQ